jgi:nucleoside-diphosphate-sugar epimerase
MKILVTGSSGFIGSHLLPRLVQDGHTVLGADRDDPQTRPPGASYRNCDILDPDAVMSVLTDFNPDALIHLAARTDLDERTNIQGYAANIDGVRNVVAAVRANRNVKRAIYTSSQLVCRMAYIPSHDQDYCPTTLYGESKVLTEKIVREEDGGGTIWCLVRPTTVWGPGMRAHYVRFFRMIEAGRFFHVGRREIRKSYGYVGNVVHQYARLLTAPAELIHRKTLYVADYEPLRFREWADTFQRELDAPPIPTYPELMARAASRIGDLINAVGLRSFPFNSFRLGNVTADYRFNLAETEKVCGPLPFSTEEGVRQTTNWLRGLRNRTNG